jgi:hypothetical protein
VHQQEVDAGVAALLGGDARALGADAGVVEVVVAEVRRVVTLDAAGLADEQLEPALGRRGRRARSC